jgi:hypothetical protein
MQSCRVPDAYGLQRTGTKNVGNYGLHVPALLSSNLAVGGIFDQANQTFVHT